MKLDRAMIERGRPEGHEDTHLVDDSLARTEGGKSKLIPSKEARNITYHAIYKALRAAY